MAKYLIITDSVSDLPKDLREQYNIEFFRLGVVVNGETQLIADLNWEAYTPEEFYGWLAEGKKLKTNQLSLEEAINRLTPYLEQGYDILYIACSSALTGSMNMFRIATEELKEKFPERRFIGVDSVKASMALGMLCIDAAKNRDAGMDIDENAAWVESHKNFYNFFATVYTLKYLKESGRIKGMAAFLGDIMGVKPIFISDKVGNNLTIKKVKGTKASMNELFECVKKVLMKEYCDRVYVGHANCLPRAELLKKRIEEELEIPVTIVAMGPIIGTTCGPGLLATFARGKEVTRFEGDGIQE